MALPKLIGINHFRVWPPTKLIRAAISRIGSISTGPDCDRCNFLISACISMIAR